MAAILKCQFEASRAFLVYYGVCFFIPQSNMEILESVDHAFKWDIITVKHSVVLALSTHFLNWWSSWNIVAQSCSREKHMIGLFT